MRAAGFLLRDGARGGQVVIVLLLPRSMYLAPHTGTLTLTTNTGGGALWTGLGEIPNPWNIPNPEEGDTPIEEFTRTRLCAPFGRTSTFFKDLFWAHVRERLSIVPKVVMFGFIARCSDGLPVRQLCRRHATPPEIVALGARLSSEGWVRVTFGATGRGWSSSSACAMSRRRSSG